MASPEDAGGAQAPEAQHAAAAGVAAAAEPTAMEADDMTQPAAQRLSAPGSEEPAAGAEAPASADGTPQQPGKDQAGHAAEPDEDPGSAPTARGRGRKARGAPQAPALDGRQQNSMQLPFVAKHAYGSPMSCECSSCFRMHCRASTANISHAGGARALRKTPSRTRGQTKKPKGVSNTPATCLALALSSTQADKMLCNVDVKLMPCISHGMQCRSSRTLILRRTPLRRTTAPSCRHAGPRAL